MTDEELLSLAESLGQALLERKLVLVTAESCTGGWIAQAVTAIPGSSGWFDRSYVTYSDRAKQEMLGVQADTIANFGAVSEQTVAEMADHALTRSGAGVAIAVSGIAGPNGAVPGKPVGTVCFAWIVRPRVAVTETRVFAGDRQTVRRNAVAFALQELLRLL
jgi:nicotinamide-nucleotide amidase